MVHGKYLTSAGDIAPILALRKEVFCDEQGYDLALERDKYDDMAFYALVFDENERPAATGRLFIDARDRFHIGRMCTRRDCRGQGYGDLAMRMLLDLALRMNAPYIVLDAQLPAMGFYARYGFKPYGGITLDEGVEHQPMRIESADIVLGGHCGGDCSACAEDCPSRGQNEGGV